MNADPIGNAIKKLILERSSPVIKFIIQVVKGRDSLYRQLTKGRDSLYLQLAKSKDCLYLQTLPKRSAKNKFSEKKEKPFFVTIYFLLIGEWREIKGCLQKTHNCFE